MKFFCCLLFVIGCFQVDGFSDVFLTDSEMDSVMAEADAVVLHDSRLMHVHKLDKAYYDISRSIHINNRAGENYCRVVMHESRFYSVDDIEAELTDTLGNRIKKLRGRDIEEAEVTPGYVLYSESKYKWFKLSHNVYPYVITYSYRIKYKSLFLWPNWRPQWNIPVVRAEYKLKIDEALKFQTKTIGFEADPVVTKEKGERTYRWYLSNIPERNRETYLPPENEVQMAILFAPEKFRLGDTEGLLWSWKTMGKWYSSLISDRCSLSPEAEATVRSLVEEVDDPYEKIRVLYRYLQEQTRYVAIYLDIGGWQPHTAESVFKNRYGDCKDLSTLLVTMLRTAGIEAYPALALTRSEGVVYEDFPSNQFNHAITFVPMKDDTLWLESTAKLHDIHDMPYDIQDINVLVVKDGIGEMLRTPGLPAAANKWTSLTSAEIFSSKDYLICSRVRTTGLQRKHFEPIFEFNTSKDAKIRLAKHFGAHIPNLTINTYEFDIEQGEGRELSISFDGVFRDAVTRIGKRIMINPNFFNRLNDNHIPDEPVEERTYAVHFNYPYVDIDTVLVSMPPYYKVEYAPDPVDLDNEIGTFKTKHFFRNDTLTYIRYHGYKSNYFSVDKYADFVAFRKKVAESDDSKFVFIRD